MTKKHFQELATNLFFSKPSDDKSTAFKQWQADVIAIGDACNRFNASFDRDKFNRWCMGGKA